jgi:hypothetical protein
MGGSAPDSDPNIGIAAMRSAETGQQMFDFMRGQANTTNRWAEQDRARYQNVFQPLQDRYVRQAENWNSPQRRAAEAREAATDVSVAARQAGQQLQRQQMQMGINPASGAGRGAAIRQRNDTALAMAGARNSARNRVEAEADSRMANAINMGSGLAVNPGTAMGISTGAMQSGGNAAMGGYNQQAELLQTDYNNRLNAWQQSQNGIMGLLGGVGQLAGAYLLPSSKKIKHDKQPFDSLGAVRKMPVEKWTYNEGAGDGGTHVGPYAEDFSKATGVGDGKALDPITMMGVTLGAVRQLDDKIQKMERGANKGKTA